MRKTIETIKTWELINVFLNDHWVIEDIGEANLKFLESNERKATYQDF